VTEAREVRWTIHKAHMARGRAWGRGGPAGTTQPRRATTRRGPRKVQVVVLLLEETHRPDYAEEHTEGESSAQPADQTLTVWHDFRISRAEHTKLITLGFLEGTIPNKPMR
jgi:hypothetical protein